MSEQATPTGYECKTLEKKIGRTTMRIQHGDLTALPVDAFVFYAREDLELGSGFGTAIQTRAGLDVKKELDELKGLKMGEALITGAGMMNAKHIIHACGPKFQEPDTESKLRKCIENSLKIADKNGLKTVAFPPMGAGFYGIPLEFCAEVMLDTIKNFLKDETSLEEVIICVVDFREYFPFKDKFENI